MEICYRIFIEEDPASTFEYGSRQKADEKLKELREKLPDKHIDMWQVTENWDWIDADPKYRT